MPGARILFGIVERMSDNDANSSANDIAVIGMALRVPGALSPEEFWFNLRNGVESIADLTSEELMAAGESPDLMRRKNYVPRAAKLGGFDTFDAEFFGFSPKEAAVMDRSIASFSNVPGRRLRTPRDFLKI